MTTSEASVAQRLDAHEQRSALFELEARYADTYDSVQPEAWAALFTEDGVYQSRPRPGMELGNFAQGRAGLTRFCREQVGTGIHTLHLPHITFHGDRAVSSIHFEWRSSHHDAYGRTHLRSLTGRYDVLYLCQAEGWRIRHRITTAFETSAKTIFGYEPTPAIVYDPSAENPDDPESYLASFT